MSDSTQYYDLASLAEASYTLFHKIDYSDIEKVKKALQDEEEYHGHFSATQAADFVATWEVVSHQKNTDSGFSATLFRSRETGALYYATRGTEPGWDDLFITDACDIVTDGLAINQIVDMYNDWQRIQADKGSVYKAAKLELLVTETAVLAEERLATPGFAGPYEMSLRTRNDVIIDMPSGRVYTIDTDVDSDQLFTDERAHGAGITISGGITAVGHSLGGHLANAFSRLFSECSDVLTINGAGFMTGLVGGLSGNAESNIRNLFDMLGGANSFDSSKILNLYGDKWMELTSMDLPVGLEQQGGHQAIYIENASDNTAGHGKEQMTDALAVYDLFIRLDKRFQTDDFQMVFDELTPIFYATGKGDDELETYEKSVNVLGELFVDNFQSISSAQWAIRDKLYKAIGQIGKNITAKQGTMKIETLGTTDANGDFTPRSPNEIANKARDNIAYRYALVNLNPFAVLGADYSRFNQNGELDLYNPITGEGQLSGMYLADRAEMLHNLIHANIHDTTVTFTDAQYIDLPKNVFLNIGEDEVCKTFAFGGDNGEELKGINLPLGFDEFGDRLYGMGGNDILRGYGGEDYLEGGRGYDELYGGDDNDTFAVIGEDSAYDLFNGGEGEDKIIGGAGDDTIRMHDFSGDNTVEEIDGREGLNIVAGTALDDKLDFSGTVLESIDHIDGGGGHDDIIGSPGNDHLKGGAGYDSLKGGGGGRHPRRW